MGMELKNNSSDKVKILLPTLAFRNWRWELFGKWENNEPDKEYFSNLLEECKPKLDKPLFYPGEKVHWYYGSPENKGVIREATIHQVLRNGIYAASLDEFELKLHDIYCRWEAQKYILECFGHLHYYAYPYQLKRPNEKFFFVDRPDVKPLYTDWIERGMVKDWSTRFKEQNND